MHLTLIAKHITASQLQSHHSPANLVPQLQLTQSPSSGLFYQQKKLVSRHQDERKYPTSFGGRQGGQRQQDGNSNLLLWDCPDPLRKCRHLEEMFLDLSSDDLAYGRRWLRGLIHLQLHGLPQVDSLHVRQQLHRQGIRDHAHPWQGQAYTVGTEQDYRKRQHHDELLLLGVRVFNVSCVIRISGPPDHKDRHH